MTIQAIIWDFGGVITSSPFEAFNRFERERGLPADFIRGINSTNPETNAWAQFESSSINLDAFDAAFAAEARAKGHEVGGREVVALLSGDLRPRMIEVLKACKSRFRIGCITNNVRSGEGPGMARDAHKAAAVADVMRLFDLVIESSIEGIRKPNPRIYTLACERLGVEPSAAVFLDDLGINLKPAKALGMQTIKVISETQAIDDLQRLTGMQFP